MLKKLIFNLGLRRINDLALSMTMEKKASMLDLGCGDGSYGERFAKRKLIRFISGIDIDPEILGEAQKLGFSTLSHDLNKPWPHPDEVFDIVLSSQNIEHVWNTRLYVEECYRVLKRGGQVIIITENMASWWNIGALLLGFETFSSTFINGWTIGNPVASHDFRLSYHDGHIRVLTYQGLKDILKRVGFKKIIIKGSGIFARHSHFMVASAMKP